MTAVFNTTDAFSGQQAVTTSHYGLGGDSSIVEHIHIKWDSSLVAVITFWTCDFPEVAVSDTAAGQWIQENPTTAVVQFSPAGAGTAVNLTVTIPGGTAGGCSIHIGNLGSARLKAQVVCTVAGQLRMRHHGKE